ncbi:MAG: ATP-binding cassette domain-containing protein [Candidatus Doudnabacteria bacterium]|nr:ATP-binding cassette domain-containing protein [Candidatus Doudnabacteria bacterium]
MNNIVEVKNLSKTYEYYKKQPGLWGAVKGLFAREKLYNEAVKNISFSVQEGELVGFIGPNGAGKTTTLKILSGILHPTSGEVKILGFVPWRRANDYLRQISLVMGNKEQLWWDLPAIDSFLLNQKIYDIPEDVFQKNLKKLSRMLQIDDILDVQVRKLSLGQRMKAELALALLHNPRILFLDEPTIGLDVVSQKGVRDFLQEYNRESRTTIILTSHYMNDIKELAGRVITIDHGQIIYDGLLENLIRQFVREKTLRVIFKNDVDAKGLAKYGKTEVHDKNLVKLIVPREQVSEITKKILTEFPVDDLLVEEVEIEEVVRLIFQKGEVIS